MNVWGLVPARAGSKGIPGKNLRSLGGESLVAIAIERLRKAGVTDIMVATDSRAIQEVAVSRGALCSELRPTNISTDDAHMYPLYRWAVETIERETSRPDVLFTTLPTTPFMPVRHLASALAQFDSDVDWVFSVNEIEHHPFRAMQIQGDRVVPHQPVSPEILWGNRQQLPPLVRFNGGLIAGRTETILAHSEYNIFRGAESDSVGFELTSQAEGFDIDNPDDLLVAELLEQRYGFIQTMMGAAE